MPGVPAVSFDTDPSRYQHLRLETDGEIARIVLAVDETAGLRPGYELKLNSYDLGVDIELADAVQRLRFEHPQVRAVVITGGLDRVFCAGANIRMLAQSEHWWKVNFCKFTNETRAAIEDATEHSGQTYLAAVNGTAAGGGYELALACEEIILVDDGSTAVSMPEVPLLAVLPGTGGLTRLVDKRGVRKDLADVVATRSEGVRGKTAQAWRLVRRDRAPEPLRGNRARTGAGGRHPVPAPAGRARRPAPPAGPAGERHHDQLPERDRGPRPGGRPGDDHGARPAGRGAGGPGRNARAGPIVLAAGDVPGARRSHPVAAHQRGGAGHLGDQDQRGRRHGARPRAPALRQRRRELAGQRDPALPQADIQTARRDQPQPHRADRARQLLRRPAAGAGPGLRPPVHAGRGAGG